MCSAARRDQCRTARDPLARDLNPKLTTVGAALALYPELGSTGEPLDEVIALFSPCDIHIGVKFLQDVRSWIVRSKQVVRTMCRAYAIGRNAGVRPAGHPRAGKPSRLFADKSVVRE